MPWHASGQPLFLHSSIDSSQPFHGPFLQCGIYTLLAACATPVQVGRYGADEFDFSAERVTASVAESLARLQTDYIDLIQCHDIEFGDLDMVGYRGQ